MEVRKGSSQDPNSAKYKLNQIAAKAYSDAQAAKERGEDAAPPPTMGWAVPEGAEPFGKARDDLDWIDPSKKLQK